jgi:DNA polymerase III delta prime subunit
MCSLWTRKYRPERIHDIFGHAKVIKELKEWLKTFKAQPKKDGGDAALPCPVLFMHGPSGIGKTVLANVLLRHFNYHIYELNAGEIRSKKRITSIMDKIFNNHTVDVMRKKSKLLRGTAIVMDEVDGMSCGDKGGLHQLFHIVQEQYHAGNTTVPVFCISNRSYDKKMAAGIYQELHLSPPSAAELTEGLQRICKKEGVVVDAGCVQACIAYTGCDVRKNIVFLQELAHFSDHKHITPATLESFQSLTHQTLTHANLFEITGMLFAQVKSRVDCFFFYQTDANLMPLMIHENVCAQLKHKKISSATFLHEHRDIMHNLGLLNRMKAQQSSEIDSSAQSAAGTSGVRSVNFEMNMPYSAVCCGEVNHRATRYVACKATQPAVVFTNSLTKSATNSSSHSFFASVSYKLNINSVYLCYALPIIVRELVTTPECIVTPAYHALTYGDVDKLVQVYQKYQSNLAADPDQQLTVSPRCRRTWKKLKGGY